MVDVARCRRCAKVAPWWSFIGNLTLAIHKLLVGILGNSAALVADAFHSFADVLGSSSILVATRVASRPPDAKFPYGRGKAEFIGAVFVYVVLLFFAGGIVYTSVQSMLAADIQPPHYVTAAGAFVSVLYNYIMYRFTACAGTRNNSPAIMADAFENRADALSSVAVIVGIIAARLIHPICDPIAAAAVGLIIIWNCQVQLRSATSGLMDRGLPPDRIAALKRAVLEHSGVCGVAFLRTRQSGVRFWIDLGIHVSEALTVDQADRVANAVRATIGSHPQCHYVEVYTYPGVSATNGTTHESVQG